MNRFRLESRLSLRPMSRQSHSSFSSLYSDYGKGYSDYYMDDDDDDDDDDDETDEDVSDSDDYFDWEDIAVKKEHNAVAWVLNNEAFCFDVITFSDKFVKATFVEANKILARRRKNLTSAAIVCSVVDELVNLATPETPPWGAMQSNQFHWASNHSSSSSYGLSTDAAAMWPKISEFNIKLGLEKLEDYVSTWERSPDWMFCVEFLGFECEDSSNVFVYEVEWSKPTQEYPIPQATASVYFALEVFKIVPYNHDRSIEVTYIFEASNVIHHPGRIDFQEKWLEDIIQAKLKFFKAFTFAVSNLFGISVWTLALNTLVLKTFVLNIQNVENEKTPNSS